MQADAIAPGQSVIVVDDLLATGKCAFRRILTSRVDQKSRATGGSASAAGELIAQLGGKTLEYLFIIELLFLNGSKKLDAPTYSIVKSDAEDGPDAP
jgi:adenine phosphoribosyltransferase